MQLPSRPTVLVDQTFDDFDALSEATRYWDLDFQQLDRGRFEGRIFQGLLGSMRIDEARFHRCLQQAGATPHGMRTFVVPASDNVCFRWRKFDVGPNDLLVFPISGELDSISNTSFHVITMSLSEATLEAAADSRGVSGLSKLLKQEKVQSVGVVPRLRRILRQAVDTLPALNSIQSVSLQNRIAMMILEALCVGAPLQNASTTPGQEEALRNSQCFIARWERQPITVTDLCEHSGVSERTLRSAFVNHFGIPPKAYLAARKLNGVRRELKSAVEHGMCINEIAATWGFWHMGQFAADYRRHFGELPSETVSRLDRKHHDATGQSRGRS